MAMKIMMMVLMMVGGCAPAYSEIPQDQAVHAILGEARGEGYIGLLAVASALRNRGSLNGVYGARSSFVVDPMLKAKALKAWKESKTNDVTSGATHWGTKSDIKIFKKQSWFKFYEPTVTIKNHTFFRRKS